MSHRPFNPLFLLLACLLASPSPRAQTFEQALAETYADNPELNAARAAQRAVDEQAPQALANWRPTISVTGSGSQESVYTHPSAVGAVEAPSTGSTGTTPQALIPPGHQNLQPYNYGVQITQPLYRGGRTIADTSRAENTILAGRAQLANEEETIFTSAGTAYLDVVRDQSIVDLEVENDQTLKRIADAFQNRLHVGEVTRTDVSQAEAQRGGSLSTRLLAQSQLAASRAAYLRYVGTMPGVLEQPDLPYALPASLEEATDAAELGNPQVLSAKYTEAAARDSVDLARNAGNPELDLIGQAGQNREGYTGSPPVANGTIEAQLNIPLYTGGLVSSQVRQARQTQSQRLIEIESARRQAHQQAVQAWQTLDATTEAVGVEREAVKSAEEAYKGAREEEKVGTKTTLDLLSTVQVLLSSEVTLAQTEHDLRVAKLNLLAAIGALTADSLHLPIRTYDPADNYQDVHDSWGGEGIKPQAATGP